MELLFGFGGRIGRLQWWLGQLAICLIWASISLGLETFTGDSLVPAQPAPGELPKFGPSALLAGLTGMILAGWINLATATKRFHDRDKTGYWFLILFAPIIGPIWLTIECGFLAGSRGINAYGWPYGRQSRLQSEVAAISARAMDRRAMQLGVGHVQRSSYRIPMTTAHQASLVTQAYQARSAALQGRSTQPTFGRRGV